MSPATSLAKPFAKPITQCPYCDHVSPAESKFCNECGAALHLMPCPHCGAVNDITVSAVCYRCHGELRENASIALPAPAAIAPTESASRQSDVLPYAIEPSARQRPHALVVAIVLIAFAAASYYTFRQRSALDGHEPVPTEVKGRNAPADTNKNAGAIIKAPADAVPNPTAPSPAAEKGITAGSAATVPAEVKAGKPDTEPAREAAPSSPSIAPTTARANAAKSAAGREAAVSPATAVVVTPDSSRARSEASKGLEQRTPNIGPCTAAVAALGLCTPEPTDRRQ